MTDIDYDFIDICLKSGFPNICYFGYFELFLGVLFLVFNIYGFAKMTIFYRKINFENLVILLSIILLIVSLIDIIIDNRIVIYILIFIRIGIISLINFKFTSMSRGIVEIKYTWINKFLIIVNFLYLIALIILRILDRDDYVCYAYYLVELFAAILLTVYCCKFLNIIKNKLYNLNLKLKRESNISKENNDNIDTKENKEIDSIVSAKSHLSIPENKNTSLLFNYNIQVGDELFYAFKKKQLTLLYLANILCTVFECVCEIFLLIFDKSDKRDYIIFSFFFISLLHNIVTFFCFFWIIRKNYNRTDIVPIDNDIIDDEGLINDNFIAQEVQEVQKIETIRRLSNFDNHNNKIIQKKATYAVDDLE